MFTELQNSCITDFNLSYKLWFQVIRSIKWEAKDGLMKRWILSEKSYISLAYWDTENHVCGRSLTKKLRWTLKTLIESNLWRFGRADTKPSLTGQEGVVDNREFLGNSGTTWSVLCDLTLRLFSANYRRHQQKMWKSNDGEWKRRIWIDEQPSTGVLHFASLLSRLLCRNKKRLNDYIASHFTYKCVGSCIN